MYKVITKVVDNELRFYLDEDNNYKNISLQLENIKALP